MDDVSIIGSLLRRPGPPRIVSSALDLEDADPRLLTILDPGTSLLCLYEHATFNEGTVWDTPRDRLVWSDVPGRRVLALYRDGRVETLIDATAFINGNAVDREGRLVHCEHGRRCISRSDRDGHPVPVLTHYRNRRFNGPNDITRAPDGSLWFSDPTYALDMPEQGSLRESELGHNSVYRWDPDGGEVRRIADFEQPNGLDFSPDGRILYVSDTSRGNGGDRHEIVAFDLAPDGSASGRRIFQVVDPGIPDGFLVDERGWIWTTSAAGIQVFSERGDRLGLIRTPHPCANCAFGGPGGKRLFVAATTTLLAFDLR